MQNLGHGALAPRRCRRDRFTRILAACALAAWALFLTLPAEADNGSQIADIGPLRIRDQFLLNMGFLAFEPAASAVLAPGANQVELVETVTNTFAHSQAYTAPLEARGRGEPADLAFLRDPAGNVFYLDGEIYRTALAFRRGITPRTQLGVSIQLLNFNGGHLDGFIEGFHDTFGLGQHGRLGAPRGGYRVYLRSNGREIFRAASPGTGLGDTVLNSRTTLIQGPRPWQVSLETAVKLPTGDRQQLLSSGHVDIGAQLTASRYFSYACVHLGLGVLRLGPHDVLGTNSQTLVSGMLGYEQGLSTHLSAILQFTVSQSPFRQLALQELSQRSLQTSLGIKYRFGQSRTLFLALTENLVHFDNTADVGFHLGLSQDFL